MAILRYGPYAFDGGFGEVSGAVSKPSPVDSNYVPVNCALDATNRWKSSFYKKIDEKFGDGSADSVVESYEESAVDFGATISEQLNALGDGDAHLKVQLKFSYQAVSDVNAYISYDISADPHEDGAVIGETRSTIDVQVFDTVEISEKDPVPPPAFVNRSTSVSGTNTTLTLPSAVLPKVVVITASAEVESLSGADTLGSMTVDITLSDSSS